MRRHKTMTVREEPLPLDGPPRMPSPPLNRNLYLSPPQKSHFLPQLPVDRHSQVPVSSNKWFRLIRDKTSLWRYSLSLSCRSRAPTRIDTSPDPRGSAMDYRTTVGITCHKGGERRKATMAFSVSSFLSKVFQVIYYIIYIGRNRK